MTLDTNSIPPQPSPPYRKQGEEIVGGLCYCKVYNSITKKKTSIFSFHLVRRARGKNLWTNGRRLEGVDVPRMINFARLIITDAQAKLNVTPLVLLIPTGQIYIET